MYHKLGTSQNDDIIVKEDLSGKGRMLTTSISSCRNYLIVNERDNSYNNVYIANIAAEKLVVKGNKKLVPKNYGKLSFIPIIENFDARYTVITYHSIR